MSTNVDYVYLRAWGYDMGSHSEYIADQVKLARADNAPQDVIYYQPFEGRSMREQQEYLTRVREGTAFLVTDDSSGKPVRVWMRVTGITRKDTAARIADYISKGVVG